MWGNLHAHDAMIGAYFVEWTPGHIDEHGANFDFVLGSWGDDTTPTDRLAISLLFRHVDGSAQFMIIDAETRPIAGGLLAQTALTRQAVLASRWAKTVFDAVDFIWENDPRIGEVTNP